MGNWLSFLPYIICAQALGVGVTWSIDMLSWIWRESEAAVFGLNFLNLFFGLPVAFFLYSKSVNDAQVLWTLFWILFWLGCLAAVQKRQMKISFRAAFWGALMQAFCFCLGWMLFIVCVLLIFPLAFLQLDEFEWFCLAFVGTALVTYALLSLFRPTIYGTWNTMRDTWRQNGKNRRVR